MNFRVLELEQILYNIPAIIVAFTLHEYMHAYVANRLGDPTPKNNGRLTLNPLVHVDWIGLLMVVLLGFGWAKPVITNPRNYANPKKGRILVALAGPLSNLAIAFVATAVMYFSQSYIYDNEFVMNMLYAFIYINLMLFAFNILPIPPLDGFHLLEVWIHPSKYQTLATFRRYGFMVLIILSIIGIFGMYIGFVTSMLLKAFTFIFSGVDMLIGLF